MFEVVFAAVIWTLTGITVVVSGLTVREAVLFRRELKESRRKRGY